MNGGSNRSQRIGRGYVIPCGIKDRHRFHLGCNSGVGRCNVFVVIVRKTDSVIVCQRCRYRGGLAVQNTLFCYGYIQNFGLNGKCINVSVPSISKRGGRNRADVIVARHSRSRQGRCREACICGELVVHFLKKSCCLIGKFFSIGQAYRAFYLVVHVALCSNKASGGSKCCEKHQKNQNAKVSDYP